MVVTPDTEIYLIHFNVTKEHQLTFPNYQSQIGFFQTLAQNHGVRLQPSSYQRQDYKIRFPAWIDEIENYNYCFFNNPSYSNKWYFCYITNMEYKNDGLTDVTIKIDVFQTYQFDFIYKNSYIEREHVNDDTRGKNTVPEGLETGEYFVNSYEYYTNFDDRCLIVTADKPVNATSQYPNDTGVALSSLNGITTYGKVYICENSTILNNLLLAFSNNTYSGGTDSITDMYFVPESCINWNDVSVVSGVPDLIYEYSSNFPMVYHYEISKPSSLDGYTPKNKKLLTFPYCFLVASNNNGSSNIYKYEKFTDSKCQFDFSCIPTPRCFYKNVTLFIYAK